MIISPVRALKDNYIWVIRQGSQAIVVDPGEAAPVQTFLTAHQLNLGAIWLTHGHADHVAGVSQLKQLYPACTVLGCASWPGVSLAVGKGSRLPVWDGKVTVWSVPGHTADHLAYLLHDAAGQLHVFCGDTLFSAGCGRVFSGTMSELYHSLQRFNALSAHTLFYPAHEYTQANLHFARQVEPDNPAIVQALNQCGQTPTLPVTLAHERQVNPFLRLNQPSLQQGLIRAGLGREEAQQPLKAFTFLREWKNRF